MQSWGTSSHFENRGTDYYPSKSAIIGMISAAFGYKRDEDGKIQKLNELDFAVRIDQDGILSRDYHIASKYKENGKFEKNYVTNRYYMEDSVFVVALSNPDDNFINKIEWTLMHPYFQLFMGRRSCPVQSDFIIGITDNDAITSLKNLEWQASEWYKKRHKNYRADIYADKGLIRTSASHIRNDRVISFSQKERKMGPRFEGRSEMILSDENEIDFFSSI